MKFDTFCKTVNVDRCSKPHPIQEKLRTTRLERMLNKYIVEEPKLTFKFLQDMKHNQKNKCCYCKVDMKTLFGEPQSITLERIDDSKMHILSNIKFACFACNSAHRKS